VFNFFKYKANPKLGVGQVAHDSMKNFPICVLEFHILFRGLQ